MALAFSIPVAESWDPGLKPNQPNHRMKPPSAPKVRLWPGMATDSPDLVYFPILGPRAIAPAIAMNPPQECTTVDPAKSWKPIRCIQRDAVRTRTAPDVEMKKEVPTQVAPKEAPKVEQPVETSKKPTYEDDYINRAAAFFGDRSEEH